MFQTLSEETQPAAGPRDLGETIKRLARPDSGAVPAPQPMAGEPTSIQCDPPAAAPEAVEPEVKPAAQVRDFPVPAAPPARQ